MTFDDYVKFTGSPANLGREGSTSGGSAWSAARRLERFSASVTRRRD